MTSGWMDDELTEGIGVEKSIFSILVCLFYFLFFPSLPLSILFDLA